MPGGIRLLVLDFDGVMTDNRVLLDDRGNEAVWVHRGDGWGIARLREAGVPVVVISGESTPLVTVRCRKLRIDAIQGCEKKLPALQQFARERNIDRGSIAYVGNDANDVDCLKWVGFPIAVADAEDEVRAVAKRITSRAGGWGAVREVTDWILAAR